MFELGFDWLLALIKLHRPNGKKSLVAENIFLRQQLIILTRKYVLKKCPKLNANDKITIGVLGSFLSKVQLLRSAIVIRPSTVLKIHRALVNAKYNLVFNPATRAGPKGPSRELIDLVVETKLKNPHMGCLQISELISLNFDFTIDQNTVHRILRKHLPSAGPSKESWLALFGIKRNHLWSIDLFRVESALFKAHWVMVVMDQYSRRIIGFSVEKGSVSAERVCRMFNRIALDQPLPKYLSTDWDGLFLSNRWEATLRIREIQHIRSVGNVPWSHPYIESVIGKIRHECTDRILFFNQHQLERRLNEYKDFYNSQRPHSSLDGRTPNLFAEDGTQREVSIRNFRWQEHCRGLFHVPAVC